MSFPLPEKYISLAHEMADTAARLARKYFREALHIADKKDLTLVTEADLAIEEALRQLIRQKTPECGVIGEEFNNENSDREFNWVIDPIDGTIAFSMGKPTFCTLIALLRNNQPVLGLILQPILNEIYFGVANQQTVYNGNNIQVGHENILSRARLSITSPHMFRRSEHMPILNKLQNTVRATSFGGDGYHYGLLASGHIDIIVERGLKLYDWAALVPIVKGAGGFIGDWQGKELNLESNGEVLAAGNKMLFEQVIELISKLN